MEAAGGEIFRLKDSHGTGKHGSGNTEGTGSRAVWTTPLLKTRLDRRRYAALVTLGGFAASIWSWGHPASAGATPTPAGTRARLPGPVADCLTHRPSCYTPQAIRTAYGIQPLLEHRIDGHGVTVVLPETAATAPEQPPAVTDIRRDLADFDRRFSLPRPRIQVITTLSGSSSSPWLARLEEVQDTELVHAVAPDATIAELLVDPTALSTPAKAAATFDEVTRIAAGRGEVISLSLSLGEHFFSAKEVSLIHSALEYARSRHLTFVGSSGDDGVLGKGSTSPQVKEVSLPASDPLVLSVGGTSLDANPVTGARILETAWNTPAGSTTDSRASGGGFSHLFARPSYQDGVAGIGAMRGVPDVAADASPYTGMAIALGAPGGSYLLVGAGGPSAAAPLWAGLIALADQEAKHPLGFVNPAIYRIARSSNYHKAFHDVISGNNTMTLVSNSEPITITGYRAGPGWDPVTGWGTPDARVFVSLLAR